MKYVLRSLITSVICAGVAIGVTPRASAELPPLTFAKFPANPQHKVAVPDGYDGLNWYHFSYLNGPPVDPPGSSNNIPVPLDNVTFELRGILARIQTDGQPFDFDSAELTSAGKNPLQLRVLGFLGGTLKYDNVYSLNLASPTEIYFDFADVTMVKFISYGPEPRLSPNRAFRLIMDNVNVQSIQGVPEAGPTELVLLGAALGSFDFLRHQFRHRRMPRRRPRFEDELLDPSVG